MMLKKTLLILTALVFLCGYRMPVNKHPAINSAKVSGMKSLSNGLSEIASKTSPALVFVSIAKSQNFGGGGNFNPFDYWFGPRDPNGKGGSKPKKSGLGSGFIVDLQKGYIVTNNHVVEGADEIELKLSNGGKYEGKIIGRDKNTDVAIVQIINKNFKRKGLTQLKMGNSNRLKVGEFVLALGAPFGLEASLSFGIVSATGRGNLKITELGNFIQTDAAINPGNSGGPLINMNGEVIGVNTAIYSQAGGYNGIGFAVPSNLAKSVAEQLINKGKVSRGYLGVLLSNVDEDLALDLGLPKGTKGTLISNVVEGSAAKKSGLETNDIIVKVDGKKVSSRKEVQNAIGLRSPGQETNITVYRRNTFSRNYKLSTINVKLGDYPDESSPTSIGNNISGKGEHGFGMTLRELTNSIRQRHNIVAKTGCYVASVQPNSPAERAGMQRGAVITTVIISKSNGEKIYYDDITPKKFRSLAAKHSRVTIQIEFQGMRYFLRLKTK